MKFKRILLCISIFCFSICTTGCGDALYTMTPEEENTITLYAAKVVTKFNQNQTTGICNVRVREGELDLPSEDSSDEEQGLSEDLVEETQEEVTEETNLEENHEEESAEAQEETTEAMASNYSLSEAIGINGMEFSCSSFDVCDEYKASSKFVLTQEQGKKYLVLYIEGKNTSGENVEISKGNQYELIVDGHKSASTKTYVSKDLANFKGTVEKGATKDYILVFQFDNSSVEDISSVSLQVTNNGETRGTTI